jgi:HK97 family phage prohead protease
MREIRTLSLDAEVRATDDTAELHFTGHAAVFDQRTWIGPKRWGFWEVVDRGFFRDVLDDPAAFLVNHDPNIVLARNGNTMSLAVDDVGLVPDARWDPDDPEARMWAARVKRGDVSKMSFAFTVAEDTWSEDDDSGEETRTLVRAGQLFDVSLVTYPAYEGTDAGMRSVREVVRRHRGVDPELEIPAPRPYESDRDRRERRHRFLASRYRLAR